ncbi:GNAT family N-acetyltransferase [Brachybacterium fresconis]|uniref:Ribosomal protein S18 acetylase RimI-like enzyme n=1 Tax=Brachybacterium fresconis TaxID=173363 RepID=A0ABS4YNI9_9MICO|nr:GNAT family N-acetyltransferase [Brachybacterium fresconis]MBP2409513.1 ribosomal protein S18 acetylase RimI-like enzyme [Brachybacterium fresconis]
MPIVIRSYEPADETSWLRCRTLTFLSTCYYDDVWARRPPSPAVQLVALDGDDAVGILDIEIDGDLATIDTVAVDPDHQGRGVASALLTRARSELPGTVSVVDAWTREDEPALEWYRAHGFAESEHYLHVYKTWEDTDAGWESPSGLSAPLTAFCHASVQDEPELRGRFSRVYVCRRFSRPVTAK